MAEIEILSSKEINVGSGNVATISEIKAADNTISTKVQFSNPAAATTSQWLNTLEKKFPVDSATFKTIGTFTVLGAYGQKICDILSGHDKGGDDASPPAGGNPTKDGPHTPFIPGNSNDDARYRTMTGQTGRTSILPRSK